MSKPVTSIAPHTFIKGDLRLDGPAVIGGHVQGNVVSSDSLEIGPEGIIDGHVEGTSVTINGTVKGNVVATLACQLGPAARVAGDLCTANLTMAKGSRFIGQVCVGDDMTDPSIATPAPKVEASKPIEINPIETRFAEPRLAETRLESHKAAVDAAEEAIQVVEATINRIEHATARMEAKAAPAAAPVTVSVPTMPAVGVLTQNVQGTLQQRAPRIIKAR